MFVDERFVSTMIRENRSTAVVTVACVSVRMQNDGKKKEGEKENKF